MSLASGVFSQILPEALLLSLIVLIGNPLIVYSILRVLGKTRKNSLYSGFAVSQISEFSIIIALLAKDAGIVGQREVATITTVALITIVSSTYMFILKERIYARLRGVLF